MLIKCPECEQTVSDKAYSCPHCGYPISSTPAPLQAKTKRPRKFRRLPNGFGSIKHLSGNRRNPYAAYPPTKEWTKTSPVARPAIGYYRTYNEAYAALADYNRLGISIEQKRTTFTDVYEMFLADFERKERASGTLSEYKSAYKLCDSLYDRVFAELRKPDFQEIFDTYSPKYSVTAMMRFKKLFNQMYHVAIENDIVDKNYSKNVVVGGKEVKKGVPFSEEEIKLLWEHKGNHYINLALVMIYTGLRVGELKVVGIEPDRLTGGLKTKSGKDRVVPIHPAIKDLINEKEFKKRFDYDTFYSQLRKIGLEFAPNDERHTPHDCRHTFSWLADTYGMDSMAKHLIMGHSLGKDVEVNTYGHRTFEQLKTEMEKIKTP